MVWSFLYFTFVSIFFGPLPSPRKYPTNFNNIITPHQYSQHTYSNESTPMSETATTYDNLHTESQDFGAFRAETTSLGPKHQLTCLAVESRAEYVPFLPKDWSEQVEEHVKDADLVIAEYFPPELESTTYNIPVLGTIAVHYSERNLGVYNRLADIAASHEKQVAVMDPANKPLFRAYDTILPSAVMYLVSGRRGKGVAGKEPDLAERIIPTATDARRMLTAAGIKQEAERWPDGGNFLYVAAPAHVKRVLGYLSQGEPGKLARMRSAAYHKATPGLDKEVRTYQHSTEDGWQLVGKDPII
jgi:hypothetical protein